MDIVSRKYIMHKGYFETRHLL